MGARQELEPGPPWVVWDTHSCLRRAFVPEGLPNSVAGYRNGGHAARLSTLQRPP